MPHCIRPLTNCNATLAYNILLILVWSFGYFPVDSICENMWTAQGNEGCLLGASHQARNVKQDELYSKTWRKKKTKNMHFQIGWGECKRRRCWSYNRFDIFTVTVSLSRIHGSMQMLAVVLDNAVETSIFITFRVKFELENQRSYTVLLLLSSSFSSSKDGLL